MRSLKLFVFVAFLSCFIHPVIADNLPDEVPAAKPADEVKTPDTTPVSAGNVAAAVKDIRLKFDTQKYKEYLDYPLCSEVLDRKKHENMAILETVLASQAAEYRELFREMSYDYPSSELLMKIQTMTSDSEAPAEKDKPAVAKIATFFAAETDIVRLNLSNSGNSKNETIPISQVKAKDLVLSTTSLMIKDRRYHRDCWATVSEVVSGKVGKTSKTGLIQYRTAKQEKRTIRATPKTCLFCKVDGKFEPAGCMTINPATELLSLGGEKKGYCKFSELLEQTPEEEFVAYNLGIMETGAYYIGKLGSELLIKN